MNDWMGLSLNASKVHERCELLIEVKTVSTQIRNSGSFPFGCNEGRVFWLNIVIITGVRIREWKTLFICRKCYLNFSGGFSELLIELVERTLYRVMTLGTWIYMRISQWQNPSWFISANLPSYFGEYWNLAWKSALSLMEKLLLNRSTVIRGDKCDHSKLLNATGSLESAWILVPIWL